MTTFRQAMIKLMVARGMFESQANEIMNQYINSDKDNPEMDRWDSNVEGYPENLQVILWMGVKPFAADWIRENLPHAWFRPMFEHNDSELTQMVEQKKLPVIIDIESSK